VAHPEAAPLVWAVDTRHAPMFWFPRDCPRGCVWPGPGTTPEDHDRFFGQSAASRLHVMEGAWHEVGGYWVADEKVDAIERVVVDDLVGRHVSAGIELRITPSIWPFWRQVIDSTVEFSGSRLANPSAGPA
jgi:hypothetical protein